MVPRRMSRPMLAALALAGITVLLPLRAAADGADPAAAEALFDQGRALLAKGLVAEACPKLEESLRLDRGIGTMLYLAECWERAGRTASAWAQFREAADLAATGTDAREKVARDHAARLEPTLSTLTITVTAPSASTVVVERDGRAVAAGLWGTALPIDPGEHVLTAVSPGHKKWTAKIVVGPNAARSTVSVPLLEALPVDGPPPAPIQTTRDWQRILGVGLATVGVAGLVVGGAFGLSAIAKNDRADSHCPDQGCDADGLAIGDKANQQATLSTIFIAAGAVLVVGGAVLFFTATKTDTPHATTAIFTRRGFTF